MRSIIPSIPKSGEQEVQIAPMLEVASIATIVSGRLVITAPITSPFLIPDFLRKPLNLETDA